MFQGFRKFLMRGDIIVLAVGLAAALAFSTLVKAFTDSVITPLVTRAQGNQPIGLGVQLGSAGNQSTYLNFGAVVSAVIYFVVFMAVVYFLLVVPYRSSQARRGNIVFGDPPPTKACPYCLSDDLPLAASKCKHCASELKAA
ncbi:MAG TPA: MscL family protein [Acidimicrobiales bacterium]|nr:MscL family protein [Acidimicrobiales bacterium]